MLICVKNYCVQQYFLVYLFFLCEFSLSSFLFINVYFFFFEKTNQCVVDLNVTYSLVSYYRYVIRMDILLGFRMFYKETNSELIKSLLLKLLVFFHPDVVCF